MNDEAITAHRSADGSGSGGTCGAVPARLEGAGVRAAVVVCLVAVVAGEVTEVDAVAADLVADRGRGRGTVNAVVAVLNVASGRAAVAINVGAVIALVPAEVETVAAYLLADLKGIEEEASTARGAELDLAVVGAPVPVVSVAVIAVRCGHAWHHEAIAAEVRAVIRASRRATRASPVGLNVAVVVATVAIDVVAVITLNVAEVVAVTALLRAHRSGCRAAGRAGEAELDVAVGVAAVTVLVVTVVAIVSPREVEREVDAVAADLRADVLVSGRAPRAEPAALDQASCRAATRESENSNLTRRRFCCCRRRTRSGRS